MANLTQIFETSMSSPTWMNGLYSDVTHNAPVILSVGPTTVDVIDRFYQANSFAASAGDGNVYHYSPITGALLSTTLQSAAPSVYQHWQLFSDNWAASWQTSDLANHFRPGFIMATTDGNNILMTAGGQALSNLTNFVSNTSASWPNGVFVFDFGKLMFNTAGFSGSDQLFEIYPCADFQHVIALTKNSVGGAVKWALINCIHGSEAVVKSGTVNDATSAGIINNAGSGGNSGIADNIPTTGLAGNNSNLGCLQSDLQTLWVVCFNRDSGSPTKFAQLVVLTINQSTLDMIITSGLSGSQGTAAFPNSNAAAPANLSVSLWADNGTCAVLCGQTLTFWSVATNLSQFDANSNLMLYQWRSKEYLLDHPTVFRYCQVKAASFAQTKLLFWADGVNYYTTVVTSENPFALPDGPNNAVNGNGYQRFMIEVHGTDKVKSIQVAESIEELI